MVGLLSLVWLDVGQREQVFYGARTAFIETLTGFQRTEPEFCPPVQVEIEQPRSRHGLPEGNLEEGAV